MPDPVQLSATPVDLVEAASLELDTQYLVQADTAATDSPVYFKEADDAPANPTQEVDQILEDRKRLVIQPSTKVWATMPVGRKRGRLLIAEAV